MAVASEVEESTVSRQIHKRISKLRKISATAGNFIGGGINYSIIIKNESNSQPDFPIYIKNYSKPNLNEAAWINING